LVAALDKVVGGLLGLEGGLGQGEGLAIGRQGQAGFRHGGDQQYLRAAAGLLGGQVFLQGAVFEAADAAKEINLPGGDAEIGLVAFHGLAPAGGGEVGGHAGLAAAAGGMNGGVELGPGDAIISAGPLDV